MKFHPTKAAVPVIFALIIMAMTSCKKNPDIPNEEEVITTLRYTLTPTGGGNAIVFSFSDLDGDGGDVPIITGGTLDTNTTYTGVLELKNEQESPAGDISAEIQTENTAHQFFFQTTIAGISTAYNDQDTNGNPLGLQTTLTTGNTGSGSFTIILRHEPDKTAAGVSGGDITNAGGETDIEVTFNINVE